MEKIFYKTLVVLFISVMIATPAFAALVTPSYSYDPGTMILIGAGLIGFVSFKKKMDRRSGRL